MPQACYMGKGEKRAPETDKGGDGRMTVEEAVMQYGDMLFRICLVMLCNEQDARDAVQDTFCRYMEHTPKFHDKEHEKAWLIRVAANRCRDMHRKRLRHPEVEWKDAAQYCEFQEHAADNTAEKKQEQEKITANTEGGGITKQQAEEIAAKAENIEMFSRQISW